MIDERQAENDNPDTPGTENRGWSINGARCCYKTDYSENEQHLRSIYTTLLPTYGTDAHHDDA